MSIKLIYPGGQVALPVEDTNTIDIPSLVAVLEVNIDGATEAFVRMGQKVWELEAGKSSLPVLWASDGKCLLVIHIGDDHYSYSIRRLPGNDIERDQIINLGSFVDDLHKLWGDGGFSVEGFLAAHKRQAIKLLAVEKPQVSAEQNDNRNHLRNVLTQQVQAICSRPKKGTKTEELVQDVGMVKEINTNTLSHLASHTEHWKAKKLTGLEPKRLLSVIIEENIDIYENLFFKMAMDDISDYVSIKLRSLKRSIEQAKKVTDVEKYKIIDYHRGEILRQLMGDQQYNEMLQFSTDHPEQKALKEWEQIAEIVQSIRNSALYKQIDPRKRISKNIHQTNILRNDQRYKALFQIWQMIRREEENDKILRQVPEQLPESPEECYATYVFFLLLWTMCNKLEISFDKDEEIHISGSMVHASLHGQDKQFRYSVKTSYDDFNQLSIIIDFLSPYPEYNLPGDCDVSMAMIEEYSDYIQIRDGRLIIIDDPDPTIYRRISRHFMQKNRNQANNSSRGNVWQKFILQVQEKQGKRTATNKDARTVVVRPLLFSLPNHSEEVSSFSKIIQKATSAMTIWITATDPSTSNNEDSIDAADWIRFALSYGELPFSMCKKPYSTMFLPVTQIDLLSSERIEKALSIHRSYLSMESAEKNNWNMSCCPACQSINIKQVDRDTWRCSDCDKQWGRTHCQGKKCGVYFYWLQPNSNNLKQLRKEDVGNQNVENIRLIQRDTVFGSTIMTDFEYEINNSEGRVDRLLPVCPHCGTRRLI